MTQPGITNERIAEIIFQNQADGVKMFLPSVETAIKQALKEEREAIADWVEKEASARVRQEARQERGVYLYEQGIGMELIAKQLREGDK